MNSGVRFRRTFGCLKYPIFTHKDSLVARLSACQGVCLSVLIRHIMGRTQLYDDFFHTHLEIFLSILF